jgi:hypothetical protein
MFAGVNAPLVRDETSEPESIFVTPELFERIVASEQNLVGIETRRADAILEQFRRFAVKASRAIYLWEDGLGLVSLREESVIVPGTTRLIEALRHIHSTLHFGVYLFRALPESLRFSAMRGQCITALRQFARGHWQDANVRKIVLLDLRVGLGDGLDQYVERIVDAPDQIKRLRLRDGRWVL